MYVCMGLTQPSLTLTLYPPPCFHDREDGFWATRVVRKDGGTNHKPH